MIEKIDENNCEHGDHLAPPGKIFCSQECMDCDAGTKECSVCRENCFHCGAPQVPYQGLRTKYSCGGSDYDRRPGTIVCPTVNDE